jgi:hypothetical protein
VICGRRFGTAQSAAANERWPLNATASRGAEPGRAGGTSKSIGEPRGGGILIRDDRPRAEQLATQRGPQNPDDLDDDGVLNVDKLMDRWRKRYQEWERKRGQNYER